MKKVFLAVCLASFWICATSMIYTNSGIQIKFSEDGIKRVLESLLGGFQETLRTVPLANVSGVFSGFQYVLLNSKMMEISGSSVDVNRDQAGQMTISLQFDRVALTSDIALYQIGSEIPPANVKMDLTKVSFSLNVESGIQSQHAISLTNCKVNFESMLATDGPQTITSVLNMLISTQKNVLEVEVTKMVCPSLEARMSNEVMTHLTLKDDIRPTACGKKMYFLYSVTTADINANGILTFQGKAAISTSKHSISTLQSPIFPTVTMAKNVQFIFTRDLIHQLVDDNSCDGIFKQKIQDVEEVTKLFNYGSARVAVTSSNTEFTYTANKLSFKKMSTINFQKTAGNEEILKSDVTVQRNLKIMFQADWIKITTHSWKIEMQADKDQDDVAKSPNCELLKIYSNKLKSTVTGNVYQIPLTDMIPQARFRDMDLVFSNDALTLNANLNVGTEAANGELIITESSLSNSISIKDKNGKEVDKCTTSSASHIQIVSSLYFISLLYIFI